MGKEAKDITGEDVDKLTSPESLEDDAMMVPVDMRGVGEEMIEKLGAKGVAEAFMKARKYFEENNKDPEAKPMTAAEWRKVLEDDQMEDRGEEAEENMMFEGEEEEL